MKKKFYIAYGSNLSVEQMAHKCPDAKVVGMAAITGWKLVFRVHAQGGSRPDLGDQRKG